MVRPVVVSLCKDLGRTLRQGHPWVYRDALNQSAGIPSGGLVAVTDKYQREVAFGYWDASGPIAVRVLDLVPVLDPAVLIERRLASALTMRRARLDLRHTNAFRWVHGEADRLPGIHVDLYANVATVRYDGAGSRSFYRNLPAQILACGGDLRIAQVIDRDARTHMCEEIEVLENGVRFIVDVGRGQKGGLFLDQRENREALALCAKGKSVLNLFGYTGGFSIYAARAGALRTDTVDIARPAIAVARRNFERNDLDLDHAGFHAQDAFAFLEHAASRRDTWDIVVSDPPSFAPSKRSVTAARRAYLRLHRLAASVVAKNGLLLAASCSSHVSRRDFLASVQSGVRQAGRRFVLESYTGAGADHPSLPAFPEGDYLKFALGRVF